MNRMPLAGGTEAFAPSLSALRRPLPDEGRRVFGGRGGGRVPRFIERMAKSVQSFERKLG